MPKSKFQVYKDEVNRLLEKAGIGGDWNIGFSTTVQAEGAQAEISYNMQHRWARFAFSYENSKGYTPAQVKKLAKHEFGHFLVARIYGLATARYVTESELQEADEGVARICERLL